MPATVHSVFRRSGGGVSSMGAGASQRSLRMAICNTCARCSARRGVDCAICSRQLKPSAMTIVSGDASRTFGRIIRSPTRIETS